MVSNRPSRRVLRASLSKALSLVIRTAALLSRAHGNWSATAYPAAAIFVTAVMLELDRRILFRLSLGLHLAADLISAGRVEVLKCNASDPPLPRSIPRPLPGSASSERGSCSYRTNGALSSGHQGIHRRRVRVTPPLVAITRSCKDCIQVCEVVIFCQPRRWRATCGNGLICDRSDG